MSRKINIDLRRFLPENNKSGEHLQGSWQAYVAGRDQLGARSLKQLKNNLGVLAWKLSDEQWNCLDEVSAIDLGFPHGFLDGNRYIYGATHDKIDNHRI